MSINASRDNNRKPMMIGVSDADGLTILNVYVNPTTHIIQTDDGSTGTDHGTVDAQRDGNFTPALLGTSSADGITPVAIYINHTTNALKVKST